MPQNRKEKTMTQRLPSSLLLGCAALLFFASVAEAQVVRPNRTLFLGARGGATAYGGELDTCADTGENPDCELGWLFNDFGWAAGLELGYQFTEGFGVSLLGLYGQYPNLDRPMRLAVGPSGPQPFPTGDDGDCEDTGTCLNESDAVPQAHLLFRYMPFPGWSFTPFVEFGGGIAFAPERTVDEDDTAFGPTIGAGFDWLIGRQLSLFLLAETTFWFPDEGFDGSNPGGNSFPLGDEADFDNSNFYGLGLRYFFRPPITDVDVMIDCATEITVGEAGSFTASINQDATQPVTVTWDFGDGTTGSGMTTTHAYSAPGTYTVTATAEGPGNMDTETCLVTVVEPQIPPSLANCRVSPSSADLGEDVTVSASVTGSEPFEVSVDFGDGTVVEGLPATHAYEEGGTYTVTITATNAFGSDTCTVTVNVADECATR
jgi:chitodextrinase